jgi:hypothetical protein
MRKTLALLLVATALTGCISGKKGPDETLVIEHLPLTLPPSFELRPPRVGESIATKRNREEAQRLILGKEIEGSKTTTEKSTDSWLIEKAGGDARNQYIREILSDEAREAPVEEKKTGWFSDVFSDAENSDPTIEELAEISRQRKAAQKNKNN